jgi:hypothetical protein
LRSQSEPGESGEGLVVERGLEEIKLTGFEQIDLAGVVAPVFQDFAHTLEAVVEEEPQKKGACKRAATIFRKLAY